MSVTVLHVLDYLKKHSNDESSVSSTELLAYLETLDIQIDRRKIYRDIDALKEFGYDIMVVHDGKKKGFRLMETTFDDVELKVLLDAVSAAGFISERQTERLSNKILALTNEKDANHLKRNISYSQHKTTNETIIYTVDAINRAINDSQAISFLYFHLDMKEKKYSNQHKPYHATPYGLKWNNNQYYMVAFCEEKQAMMTYRVDRMEQVQPCESHHTRDPHYQMEQQFQNSFDMYQGEKQHIIFECKRDKYPIMLDRFGSDLLILKQNEETFTFAQDIQLSPVFWGWLFQMSDSLKIVGPEDVKQQYAKQLELALETLKC